MRQVREVERTIVVTGPLRRDHESRRWYGGGGSVCLVLTARGRLLEPYPTYGPREYRLLARKVNPAEANSYAIEHGYHHLRVVDAPHDSRR
jgi:hypothetical protein